MSDELEERLRRDLSTLDSVSIGDAGRVEVASRSAAERVGRRRRGAVAGASVVLIAVGAVGVWSIRSGPDDVTTIDTGAPPTETSSVASASPPPTSAGQVSSSPGWQPIAGDPRGAVLFPSVVWANGEAIVVDGRDLVGNGVAGAARYTPATDSWALAADPPLAATSAGRINTLSFWTGREAVVLGGDLPDGSLLVSYGLAYDPAADDWRVTATPPEFVNARSPWGWTGTELLVWPWDAGGSSAEIAPLAYDPDSDTWRELPVPPVTRRQQAASVWTGTEWVVWGGTDNGVELGDGVAYDPASDSWRVLAESPLSPRRARGTWTGTEMIVAAGSSGGDPVTGNGEFAHADGAAYNPSTDTWRSIASGPAHPGFEPLWTGSQVLMFAKGGVISYAPASDQWTNDCCGASPTTVAGSPVWTGSQALLIGSDDPSIGGATYTPPVDTGVQSTGPTTTGDPVQPDVDELAASLTALGVDIAGAPATATQLGDAAFCGVERQSQGAPADRGLDEPARRCFLDHHIAAQPAVFVEEFPTVEGDPIVTVWRTLADGTIEQHVDATRDTFGSGTWQSITCGRLTTRFPQAPEPLPPSYFGCDAAPIESVGRLQELSAPMPSWFEQRQPLPLCGYEVRISDRDLVRRACFADAVRDGRPAEYAHVSTGDESERSTRWFRSLGDGTFEILEWQSADALGSTSRWLRHRCITITFADDPGGEVDQLPQLNANGECSEIRYGSIAGTLTMDGGPAPGMSTATAGTVTISDIETGAVTTASTDAEGHFAADVPAGTYTLSAATRRYNDGQSSCPALEPITVAPGGTSTVDISCPMK